MCCRCLSNGRFPKNIGHTHTALLNGAIVFVFSWHMFFILHPVLNPVPVQPPRTCYGLGSLNWPLLRKDGAEESSLAGHLVLPSAPIGRTRAAPGRHGPSGRNGAPGGETPAVLPEL